MKRCWDETKVRHWLNFVMSGDYERLDDVNKLGG